MKQDLKINYGILDGIIEQLRTYKNALDTMDSSLETLVGFINNNYADSIDAWDELVKDSKKHIKEYREQIGDLLSLFEGYVDDTTAHISPIARNAMMRVDRRDIWANLCQLESGINNNVPKAIRITKNEPFTLAFWDDPTDEEKEKSRSNKAKLDYIRGEISSTQTILDRKMDALWNIFDNKIVPYENTDDAYNNKAAAVKSKYTNFFEGIIDQFEQDIKVATSFIKGLVEGIVDILVGIVTIVVDASIVAVSNHIPDTIEPDFIKNPANEVKAKYGKMISDAIEDPFGIFESIGQGISDTVEEEGIAYIAGNAAPSLIPYVGVVGKAKWLKAVDNGDGPKTNSVTEALKPKVNDLVRNNKAFEGIKQRGVEVVTKTANGAIHVVKQLDKGINSVRNGLVYVADNVVGGIDVFIDIMKRNGNIDNNAVYVNVPNKPNVPWNVLDNKVIQENIVAPLKMMFSKLSGGGKGDRVDDGGTGKDYETSKPPKWSNDGQYDKVRAYRGRDLTAYNSEYLVDPRLVVEMNFKGKERSGTNAAGWERNAKKFFNSLLKSNPEFWSVENTTLIKRGRVPKVDEQFLEHFPQYREYIQEPMRHHHIGEGGQAAALPKSLHPGYGGIHNVEKDWGITGVDDEIARRLDTFIKDSGR